MGNNGTSASQTQVPFGQIQSASQKDKQIENITSISTGPKYVGGAEYTSTTFNKDAPKEGNIRAKSKEEEQDNVIQLGLGSAKMTSKTGRVGNQTRTTMLGPGTTTGIGHLNT